MGRNRFIPSLIFLLGLILIIQIFGFATIVAEETDNFSYDAVFWDDWTDTGNGAYEWNVRNNTIRLIANTAYGENKNFTIFRPFEIKEDDEEIRVSYYYRLQTQNGTSWLYRKSHTLTGSTSTDLTDYPLKFILKYGAGADSGNTIYLNSHSRTDFGDLRFISSGAECDYWFEEKHDSDNVTVWVEVPSIPQDPATTIIYIYYGNSGATSNSNGDNVFTDFIDMEDGTINEWDSTFGTATKTASTDNPHTGTYDLKLVPAGGAPPTSGVEETISAWDDGHAYRIWFYDALTQVAGYDEQIYINDGSLNVHLGYLDTNPNYYYEDGGGWQDSGISRSAGFHYYEFRVLPASIHFIIDGNDIHTSTRLIETSLNYFRALCFRANPNPSWFDDFLVRKYISAEPTHTSTGSEQEGGEDAPHQFTTSLIYSATAQNESIRIIHNATAIEVKYNDRGGTEQSHSKNFTTIESDGNDYFKVDCAISSTYRELTFRLENGSRQNVISEIFRIEAIPPRFLGLQFNNSVQNLMHSSYNSSVEIVWAEAPFPQVEGMRTWRFSGTNSSDTPYYLTRATVTANKSANIKVMPFQGIKFLYNLTYFSGDDALSFVQIRWYDRGGTLKGGVFFETITSTINTIFYTGYITASNDQYTVLTKTLAFQSGVSCAVWTEKSGRSYVYVQYTPHSSEFQDFFMYDITNYVDLETWGVEILHKVWYRLADYNAHCISKLGEVEIFYGLREGISQPRFGGMWWETNPLIILMIGLGFLISSAFLAIITPLATAISTALSPFLTVITSAIEGAYAWFANISDIWGVLTDFWTDIAPNIWAEFLTNVLEPLWEFLTTWFVGGLFMSAVLLQSVFDSVLGAISLWFWGDATILPNLVGAIFLFMFEVIKGLGYFLVEGKLFTIGFYFLSLLSGVNQPFGWATMYAGLPDMLVLSIYWAVTMFPPFFVLYILITLLRCVTIFFAGDFSVDAFKPLFDMFMFFWTIAEFTFNLLRGLIGLIWSGITAIMEIIPF